MFHRLAEAESRVHGIPVEPVHSNEVGAMDAIIDVVGAAIALERGAPIRLVYEAVVRQMDRAG